MRELAIPADASADPEAFEYLRLWSTERGDQLNALTAYGDAEVWGIVLADAGRKIARSLAAESKTSADQQLHLIERAFSAELNAQSPRA